MECWVEKKDLKRQLIESLPEVDEASGNYTLSLYFADIIENRLMVTYGHSEHKNH